MSDTVEIEVVEEVVEILEIAEKGDPGTPVEHNNLLGLNDGDFQHLTAAQFAEPSEAESIDPAGAVKRMWTARRVWGAFAAFITSGRAYILQGATETAAATHDATTGTGYTVNATTNDHTITADGTGFTITKGSGWEGTTKKSRVSIRFRLTGADGTLPAIVFSGFTWVNSAPDLSGMTPDTGGAVLELYETSDGTVQGVWGVH